MLANKASHKVKEQQGMVLAVVVIIFAVIMIMTATVVTVVYSDTKLSLDDENGKKAYYAARSAIEITERAILKNLGELQDTKGTIISNIKSEVDSLNESFASGIPATEEEYEMELDAILASYSSDIDDYKSQYISFRNNVLPISDQYTHKVTIDGFDTDSNVFDVIVTPLLNTDPDDDIIIDAFRLDTTAAVNGKKVSVSKWVGIEVKIGDDITIEKMEQATSSDNHIFDDAIYSYGNLQFGPGGGGGSMAQIIGTVTYEGEITNGDNVNVTPYHKSPPTPKEDIVEPASLVPGGVEDLQERTNTLPSNITSANNGYYKQDVTLSGTYNVNTSYGDVILKFSSLTVGKNGYKFNISGGNDLYFYLYDEKANGVNFNSDRNSNNETPFACTGGSSFYFIIDQPKDQRDPSTNVMSFNLGKNKTTMINVYLYAPFTTVSFKNKFDFTGSLVVGGIDMKNNAKVTYKAPTNNPAGPGDLVFVGEEISIPISGTYSMNYNSGSYWLKK